MIGRREFVTLFGGAVAWPLAARAQQPAMPVIGFLHPASAHAAGDQLRAFRQGLKDAGFIEGENVAIEYRSADDQIDRLPALATELVQRRVAVIATGSPPAVFAASIAGRRNPRPAAAATRAGAIAARVHDRARRADDAQGVSCPIRPDSLLY
jgi:putative ABC transport system substrate-binding protein